MIKRGETKYVNVDGSDVGYQVVGKGSVDLVLITHAGHNIETQWDLPPIAYALDRLASFSRLIMFDRRGTGTSDPPKEGSFPGWEGWMEDLKAVLHAAGSARAAFLGEFDGGAEAAIFAATFPDRTTSLALWCPYARLAASEDYPIGIPTETGDELLGMFAKLWGTVEYARTLLPSRADDEEMMRALARFMRTGATPHAVERNFRWSMEMDARPALPAVRVPTLVMHREGYAAIPQAWSRFMADHIPGARFVEVPGDDAGWWGEGSDQILSTIEEFVTGSKPRAAYNRQLATVLFTDIVSSTERAASLGDRRWKELLEEHDRAARYLIRDVAGRLIKTTGDGIFATFDGPGRAIKCAVELGEKLAEEGIQIRAGVHTGEVEIRSDGDLGGIAVHIGARVMSEAGAGEILCSRTVKDLVVGSEYQFEDRGMCVLKGVPDEWQLFAVRTS